MCTNITADAGRYIEFFLPLHWARYRRKDVITGQGGLTDPLRPKSISSELHLKGSLHYSKVSDRRNSEVLM